MANAPADHQLRLLDVQDADTRAQQARHRRDSLPVVQRIAELEGRALDLADERIARGAEASDIRREVTKAEDDVQSVRARAERDNARLESGQGSAKDLQALQSELEVLARRQSALEDVELEAMERLEEAEAAEASAAEQHAAITAQIDELRAERDAAYTQIDAELVAIAAERDAAVADLDADLVALYERLRDQHGGTGAAALRGGTCLGCHMTLNPVDLKAIDDAPADRIVRCEECGRILVRGATA